MSLGLFANDLLVDLANHGEKAEAEVGAQVRSLLAKPPGPWLPESYDAAYELLERAFLEATPKGKKVLSKVTRRVREVLGNKLAMGKLSEKESRQLLGAMAVVPRFHSAVPDLYSMARDPLCIALSFPSLFWERVSLAPEIVGETDQDRQDFLAHLKEYLLPSKKTLDVSKATQYVVRAAPTNKAMRYAASVQCPSGSRVYVVGTNRTALNRRLNSLIGVRISDAEPEDIVVNFKNYDDVKVANLIQTRHAYAS